MCYERKKTLNQDKKLRLLLAPFIFYGAFPCSLDHFCDCTIHTRNTGSDKDSICGNIMYTSIFMGFHILSYSNRRIYCDTGYIYGCFLDMDFVEKEGDCNVLYSVACPRCFVNSIVLEVWGFILLFSKCVIKVLGFSVGNIL